MTTLQIFALMRPAPRHGYRRGYTRRMTSPTSRESAVSTPDSAPELAALTPTEAARITGAITANYAPTTIAAYGWAWRHFSTWCTSRDLEPLPATATTVCLYLTERAEQGVRFGTISLTSSAIGYHHRRAGATDPTDTAMVCLVRRGLRRTLGMTPIRQAHPLSVDDVRALLDPIDRTTAAGARDAALILLGFASALRRGELAALTVADLELKPAGLLINVTGSKTDPDRRG